MIATSSGSNGVIALSCYSRVNLPRRTHDKRGRDTADSTNAISKAVFALIPVLDYSLGCIVWPHDIVLK